MLKLRIERRDLSRPWRLDGGRWVCDRSWLSFLDNPRLEQISAGSERLRLFALRERLELAGSVPVQDGPASLERVEALRRAVATWPLEFVSVSLRPDASSLEIECGRWGSAPLYLVARGEVLHGSWDPADLYPLLAGDALSPAFVARFFSGFEHPYSRRTVFRSLLRLTERGSARWTEDGLEVRYPPASPVPRPHRLKPGTDPAAIADEILTAAMSRTLRGARGRTGAELSGGLDSAVVAITASEVGEAPLRTYGLLQEGEQGALQRRRRQELIGRFGFVDVALEAFCHPPLVEPRRLVPWEEIYTEATCALLRRAVADGVVAMLNGIGGDELCSLHRSERRAGAGEGASDAIEEYPVPSFVTPRTVEALRDADVDVAPRPTMAYSTLEGLASAAPLVLRHGLWQQAPLSTPELFYFARSLPTEWRAGRRLSRQLLVRRGCSRAVTHPRSTETFDALFRTGFADGASHRVRALFTDSLLAARGWVDPDRLRSSYEDYCAGRPLDRCDDVQLYAAAALEESLRQIESAESELGEPS